MGCLDEDGLSSRDECAIVHSVYGDQDRRITGGGIDAT